MANQCCKSCSLNNHLVYFLIIIALVYANTSDDHLEPVPSHSRTPESIPIVVPLGNLPDRQDTSGGHLEEVQPHKIPEEIAPQEEINVLEPVSTIKTTTNTINTIPTSTTRNDENRTEHRTTTVSPNQGNDIASISFGNRLNNDTTTIPPQETSFNISLDNVTSATEFHTTSAYSTEESEAESAETSNANIDQTTVEPEDVDHQITSTLDEFEEATTTGSEDPINSTDSTVGSFESTQNSTLEDSYSQNQVTLALTTPSNDLTTTKPISNITLTSPNFGDRITELHATPNYATSEKPLTIPTIPVNVTHDHMSNATTVPFNANHEVATVGTSKAISSMPVGNEQSLEPQGTADGLKCNNCDHENNKPSSGQSTQTQHGHNIQDIAKDVTTAIVPPANQTVKELTRKPSEQNNQSTERPRIDTTESRNKWDHKKTEMPSGGSTDRWPNNGQKTQTDFTLTKAPSTYMSMMLHCTWSYFCLHWLAFQRALASQLTSVARIDTNNTQIVFFNCDVCRHPRDDAMSVASWTGPIDVPFYVTDKTGQYSKALTELLAFILMKSKPSENFSSVIISIRLHRQEEDAAFNTGVEGNPSAGVVAAIAISCIAGICLVFVCILLLILKKRHERQLQNQRCRKVSDGYSLDSISIYSSFTRRRKASKRSFLNHAFDDPTCPSNKVNFAGLANLSQDPEALAEEFKQIPVIHPRYEDLPAGAELKNRYANIIPVPETRVPLTKKSDSCSDYINANFIRGLGDDSKKYIACQAPLPNTIGDFWRMIWEQQSKVIIMLTQFDEDHVPKCGQYFPRSSTVDFHHLHGDFQITNKKVDSRTDYTITTLQIKNLERNLVRDVVHLWFTAWTSRDVHPDADSVLHFLLEANSYITSNPGPTVVHCSNGTGRTGAILAIHICMREFIYARMVDIPKCVYRIRQDRCGAVQTKEQYTLIYEVLSEYATRVMNNSIASSRRSSNRSLSRSSRN